MPATESIKNCKNIETKHTIKTKQKKVASCLDKQTSRQITK